MGFDRQVARGVPFDPSSSLSTARNVQAAIDELRLKGSFMALTFSRVGATSANTYLQHGAAVPSNSSPVPLAGTNALYKIMISLGAAVATTPLVIQLQRRTALNTFSDIAGASITVPVAQFRASLTLSTAITLGPDWELAAVQKSGSSTSPVVNFFILPVG